MKPVIAYIGLGSNLGDPAANLRSALQHLANADALTIQAVSQFYTSKPMGPQNQPDYVNAVACVETSLNPAALLQTLFRIEHAHGRIRDASLRWGPRTLDLDLLLYGSLTLDSPELRLPHPGICERSFVILPLAELAPDLVLPHGRSIQDCLAALACDDLYPLA